jgi:hypothetical protein
MAAASPEAQALLERWRSEENFDERDELLKQLETSGIFPSEYEGRLELESGLYPDLNDPQFLPKLLRKREFQESKQKTIAESLAEGIDRCRTSEDFELSSVQRFVSRMMSPRTPYNSSLFYHGVGVGKTCAAVTVCESYLEAYPGRKVYIVAPPNIQEGFRRTIFDREGLRIAKGASHNSHRGCTGDIYLALTNTFTERDSKVIEQKVLKAIKTRYEFFGYTSFYNHIRRTMSKIPSGIGASESETLKRTIIRTEFSNRAIVIDEAHNLRDVLTETEEDSKDDMGPIEDSKGGKKLTPYLQEVLEVSEGITLLLMTATPMYNSYSEIVFLLNLLLTNDKFPRLDLNDVFDLKKEIFNDAKGGRKLLGKIASCYVSFMRGENPLTFPLRLEPIDKTRITKWATLTPKRLPLAPVDSDPVSKLPCIAASFSPSIEKIYKSTAEAVIDSAEGLGITNMDLLIQAGNWIFPGSEDDDILDRVRQGGFDNVFLKEKRGAGVQFRCQGDIGAKWLLQENLPSASGKCALLLNRLNNAKGVMFVYSRFVASGALSIALALEANGYSPAIGGPLLADGNQHPDGRQCALCERKERGHGQVEGSIANAEKKVIKHTFKAAKYVLLTGSEEISQNNAASINAARAATNTRGEDVKVVIGSQIAGEGLDLRYVREVIVFDSWYHLNKLEQIIGRGIRNCSHSALDEDDMNCTVSLLVNVYASEPELETIDMYSYRNALRKAVTVGNVTRVLKEYAMDCTLNKDAIVIEGIDALPMLYDSQGLLRTNVNRKDTPLTSMCDWLDKCQYDCLVTDTVGLSPLDGKWTQDAFKTTGDASRGLEAVPLELQDSSTYDEYTARYHLNTLRKYIQELFGESEQAYITFEDVQRHFNTIPIPLLASLMAEMIQQKEMKIRIERNGMVQDGRVIYKNGFYLFQPDKIRDTSIPLAIRVAAIPIARDHYMPKALAVKKEEKLLINEEISKKIAIGSEDSEALWEEVLEWAASIKDGKADTIIPESLVSEVSNLRESSGILKAQRERLEMILWVYDSIKGNSAALNVFSDCVLDFFWDEFITHGTRRELLSLRPHDPLLKVVAKDSYWTLEGNTYIRFLGHDNKIEYICVAANGTTSPCSRAISEVLQREVADDPVLKGSLDVRTTGYEYGFILYNPKKTKFIYKKGKPPMPKGKVGRGSECSINSKISYEIKLLEKFGESLRASGQPDLGLSSDGLSRRRIQNSVRICTVCDLVQRFMDKTRVGGKRWFYRPLEAKLYDHPLR